VLGIAYGYGWAVWFTFSVNQRFERKSNHSENKIPDNPRHHSADSQRDPDGRRRSLRPLRRGGPEYMWSDRDMEEPGGAGKEATSGHHGSFPDDQSGHGGGHPGRHLANVSHRRCPKRGSKAKEEGIAEHYPDED